MEKEIENKLFDMLFIKSKKYGDVEKEMNIPLYEIQEYYSRISKERFSDIEKLRRIRTLYNNKKSIKGYHLGDFPDFYHWYIRQESFQKCKCYYCGSEEYKIRALVDSGFFGKSKQMINRGKHLEIERKDSKNNEYSPNNCVLACYFCNNNKSDVISEKDYFKYFVNENPSNRKMYVDDKYAEIIKKGK